MIGASAGAMLTACLQPVMHTDLPGAGQVGEPPLAAWPKPWWRGAEISVHRVAGRPADPGPSARRYTVASSSPPSSGRCLQASGGICEVPGIGPGRRTGREADCPTEVHRRLVTGCGVRIDGEDMWSCKGNGPQHPRGAAQCGQERAACRSRPECESSNRVPDRPCIGHQNGRDHSLQRVLAWAAAMG